MAYFDDMETYFKKIMGKMFREMAEFDEAVKSGKMQGKWDIRPIERPGVKGFVAQRQFWFGNEPSKSNAPLTVPKEELGEAREPLVDVFENKDAVKLYVELPGVEKDDIQLSVTGGHAEIKAKSFYKKIALPTRDVEFDKISANCKNGVLQATIPKKTKIDIEEKKTIKID
jgi:HSP20 family protein